MGLAILPAIAGAQTNLGSVNVGNTTTVAVTVTFQSPGTLGGIAVLTKGVAGLDFTDAGGDTCTVGTTYGEGQACTVNVTFKPRFPGPRYGAIELFTGSDVPLATNYVQGTGIGPQAVFANETSGTALPSAQSESNVAFKGMAVDESGNFFFIPPSSGSSGEVDELLAAGGYKTWKAVASGFSYPEGLAMDGSGSLFVTVASGVQKILALGGYSTVITLPISGLEEDPGAIAVDGNGNIFVVDSLNRAIKEISAASGYTTVETLATGFEAPPWLTVDGSGNIYVADSENGAIKKIVAVNGSIPSSPTIVTLASGLFSPWGVAVDASGNVFFTDQQGEIDGYNRAREILAVDGNIPSSPTILTLAYGGYGSGPLALEGNGNILFGSVSNVDAELFSLDYADPPALNFAPTDVGSTSSSQKVVVTNNGNGPLTFPVLTTGDNPRISSDFVWSSSSNCGRTSSSSSTAFTLAKSGRCSMIFEFEPQAGGTIEGSAVITDDSLNVAGTTQMIPLSGTGVDIPQASLSATSLSFGSVAVGAASTSQSVTLTNTGTSPLAISSIAVTAANASSFKSTNTCGTTLAVGASCTIQGEFAPLATGALTAAVTITDNASNSPQSIALNGIGITGSVTLSAYSLYFGSLSLGYSSPSQYVALTNSGSAALSITSILVTGTNASSFVFANSCKTSLAVGANCSIHGHFAPTAAGALVAAITITDSATTSPQAITLSGTGVPLPVTLSATSLSYGSVTLGEATGSQSVTVTNSGTSALSLTSIALTGTDASSFVFANSCGTSLAVGASCAIHGYFAPTTAGVLTATVSITDSATTSPQTISLSGTGQTAPVTLSAASLSFPATLVGAASPSQTVTVTNAGSATLSITSINVTGARASSFVFANTCGTSITAGADCTIHGHFAPTTGGALTAAITITDGATTSPQTLTLSGNGVNPLVSLSANILAFGSITENTSAESQAVTLTNVGTTSLDITSIAITGPNASQFAFGNDCDASLAVGSSCSIHGHFAPAALGSASALIAITDNALNSPQSISVTGTGVPATSGVTLSATSLPAGSTPTKLVFGPVVVDSSSPTDYISMTNTGTSALSITGLTVTGTNASQFVFTNNCGTSLAVGSSCTIQGHFAPTAAASMTASVTITDSDPTSPQTISLSGTGLAASGAVTLSATSISFGYQVVGTTSESQSVTLTNIGDSTLAITSISLTGTDVSSFVFGNSCGSSLAVGATCTIHGHFAPAAAGALNAAVTVTGSFPGSPESISLSGMGTNTTASLSATSVWFRNQVVGTTSESQSVTLRSTGGSTLAITSISLTGADASSFVFANDCGTSLTVGASCTIHGHFTPAATGVLTAAINITDTGTGTPQLIALTGTTVPVPPATGLLVLGNSITISGPSPSEGWEGDWGMAASAAANDFAHLTAEGLNLPLSVHNIAAQFEENPANSGPTIQLMASYVTPGTAVVLEFGEDVHLSELAAFQTAYTQLVAAVSRGRTLTCLSTYWENYPMDQIMQSACQSYGGTWINIGDIFTDPNNPDYTNPPAFPSAGVQFHPHDWSMQQIANRVIAADPSTRP